MTTVEPQLTGDAPEGRAVSVPLHGEEHRVDPMAVKVAHVRAAFGSNASLASWLGVARSQPGRWIEGRERPNPAAARQIKDFEYVWDRATDEMPPEHAARWLQQPNPFLGGTTPLTVLAARGPAEVIPALDSHASDVYA